MTLYVKDATILSQIFIFIFFFGLVAVNEWNISQSMQRFFQSKGKKMSSDRLFSQPAGDFL